MCEGNTLVLDIHQTQHDVLVQDTSHFITKSQFIPFDDIIIFAKLNLALLALIKNKHGTKISTEQEMKGAVSNLIPRSEKVCRHICLSSKYP